MWNTFFYHPLVNALIFLYELLGHNLGLAIIGLTVLIRLVLTPLTLPSLKTGQKMKELQPELAKLKEKYGKDKQVFAKKQLELFQSHGLNPAAGCLPQIIQIVVLIALYQAFNQVLQSRGDLVTNLNNILYPVLKLPLDFSLNSRFLYLNLTQPDLFSIPAIKILGLTIDKFPGIFLIAAAVVQFLSSKLMMPAAKKNAVVAQKTPGQADDMATAMQTQMLYLFPLMTIFIGFKFPSGLVLYWLVFSLIMLVQQLTLNYGKKH
ncbi:MAG: YidC/Oxa1 family membrane protein insertase [Candidatus Beckwithbacteria bacterium]|nr:YidC/Oxa1 family membrane protein insertase [Candidatus Beckwithbacteria bacterium]